MKIQPISLANANKFVIENHRHHNAVQGHKFSISAVQGEEIIGVAIVGRPVSRYMDDGKTLEVLRLCTDGTQNACSFLYGRCARIARDMGYERIITYILESESGTSLKASGWICESEKCGGGSWDCKARPRNVVDVTLFGEVVKYPTASKKRYTLNLTRNK